MTAKDNNLSGTDNGGASLRSVPQNPLEFLKSYAGRKVYLRMGGLFDEDLVGRFGKVYKTEVFEGVLEGKYRVEIDSFGDVLLRYPYHVIGIRNLKWVEIDGIMVSENEE